MGDLIYFAYSITFVSRRTCDLDLTGILQLVLDALGELARQNDHLILVDLLGLDHHADLTAGLNGVALLDAGIGAA